MPNSLNCNDIVAQVKAHQSALEQMGVKSLEIFSLEIFGSVARDEATPQSDVDFLVEFSKPVGFFQVFNVQYFLEDLLQRPIDLGTADSLKEHLRLPVLERTIRVF